MTAEPEPVEVEEDAPLDYAIDNLSDLEDGAERIIGFMEALREELIADLGVDAWQWRTHLPPVQRVLLAEIEITAQGIHRDANRAYRWIIEHQHNQEKPK
ncbi:MAG: hypothetical protein E5X53_30815 [Mesorhizobium sp.]|uniref:hypothetical protein n=1 Tax=Mesorhizobium sp. TaxID=1871066 RepID=UPI0011F7D61E|nr:hypothetical protein [Mesorhizobium sp.]TIP69778.1 MAG: hypothetical protein E5X55_30610 [Mesorhizobium sp.]TIQ04347.1 MAG: hypothetical protein E5X57_29495 [Mesorhizobium sp.]TIR48151.1 MAG: hypothetical protein E5X53_30815 [Mesorhizobium sp.]TJV94555.1 MAG: hypothetical protein E5X52_28485 [Mesorhizobium sp.]